MKLRKSLVKPVTRQKNLQLVLYLLFARNRQCDNHMYASMRQDSETNIIVFNTALKYKIISSCLVLPPDIVMHDDAFNVIF